MKILLAGEATHRPLLILVLAVVVAVAVMGPLAPFANASPLPSGATAPVQANGLDPQCVRQDLAILAGRYRNPSWMEPLRVVLEVVSMSNTVRDARIKVGIAVASLGFRWGYYGSAIGYYATAIVTDCWR